MEGIFDNHNHSQFSFDGKGTTVEKSARAALDKGLDGICFSDHYDFHVPPMKAAHENLVPEIFDIGLQQAEIDRVREIVPDMTILKGIEIGLQINSRDNIRELMSAHSFDQVIASVHYLDDTDPFYGGYYADKDWKEAYGHYLETLYKEMVWLGDFDIMGHYDYVARYAPYPQASIMYKDFSDIFDAILTYLAHEGKALEINTKSYQEYNGRTPVLDTDILVRYRELGGELVSLGSDSHNPQRVGDRFGQYLSIAEAAGFRYIAHFEKRRLINSPLRKGI